VLVNGAGPGLGKSTLVQQLAAALRERGHRVEVFLEAGILRRPEFERVMAEFGSMPRVDLATLLDAAVAYLANCTSEVADAYILDALFPYWLSLAVGLG